MQSLPFGKTASILTPRWYQEGAFRALWTGMKRHPCAAMLPTGAGKSLVIAMLCREALKYGGRVLVLMPAKELIEQNYREFCELCPEMDAGLYSAGLRKRDTDHDILFAGIQSVYDKFHQLGRRDMCLIDEGHLIRQDGEGRFGKLFADANQLCPHMVIGALTATPYRTGTGALCGPENVLKELVFTAPIGRLMEEGFLCPIVNKPTAVEYDTSKCRVSSSTHEYVASEVDSVYGDEDLMEQSLRDVIDKTHDRHSVLMFCSGVANAERVAERMRALTGQQVGFIVGDKQKTTDLERAAYINRFANNELKWLVNVDVLTTGFNAKCTDTVVMLRSILSPGLVAQMVGREFRIHESKTDALLLDYGGNIKRHGPIDSPTYGIPPEKPKKETANAGMPSKECPACFEAIPISAVRCPECGFEYPPKPKHEANADTESAILQSQVEPTIYSVESASFHRHEKRNDPDAPNTLRVDYVCQLADGGGNLTRQVISEWVCLDHDGFARRNADKWWRERSNAVLTEDLNESRIDSAIDWWQRGAVAIAHTLWVVPQGRFRKITKQELDDIPETWADEQEAVALAYDASGFDYSSLKFGGDLPF